MHPHHEQTIQNVIGYFKDQDDVSALLLSGSIAHGFETAESDVDILIVVTEESYQERQRSGKLTFFNTELCAEWPAGGSGYVDGKYLALSVIRQVADKGSEAARFAFDGVRVLFNKADDEDGNQLASELARAVAYPVAGKAERIARFRMQLEAWNWFCGEARKKQNDYLLGLAVSKLALFGGRLVLAHNEMLYPFHKWFLRVLETAPDKPADLMKCIRELVSERSPEKIEAFYRTVADFQDWGVDPTRWGATFMVDSEMNWVDGKTPVDDL